MLGLGVWDLKKGKAIHMEIEKQMSGKQMFARPEEKWTLISRSYCCPPHLAHILGGYLW